MRKSSFTQNIRNNSEVIKPRKMSHINSLNSSKHNSRKSSTSKQSNSKSKFKCKQKAEKMLFNAYDQH